MRCRSYESFRASQATVRDRDTETESKCTSTGGPGDSASPASFTPDPAGLTQLALILQLPPHLREIRLPKAVCFPRLFPRTKREGRLRMWGGDGNIHQASASYPAQIFGEEGGQRGHWELSSFCNTSSERFCLSCF